MPKTCLEANSFDPRRAHGADYEPGDDHSEGEQRKCGVQNGHGLYLKIHEVSLCPSPVKNKQTTDERECRKDELFGYFKIPGCDR